MHVAPVVVLPHAAGEPGWSQGLAAVLDCLSRHRSLVVTVRAPGVAVEHLSREETELWEELPLDRIMWLAGGFSDPVLTSLPPAAAEAQLKREAMVMEAAGTTPAGLWVGDCWDPSLISLARASALSLVFIDAALVAHVPDRPGAVERAGETVVAVPVLDDLPAARPEDGLAAVRVAAGELEDLVESSPGRLTHPDAYLSDHLPGDRLAPPVASPARHPEREAFYRKLLVLTADQTDRSPGRDAILRLQSRENLLTDTTAGPDRELIEARQALDRSRHRGDSWVELRDIDWDADAVDEVWVETPDHTLVLDPLHGTLDVWDDKAFAWPIGEVRPTLPGLVVRRLDDDDSTAPRMEAEERAEGRSHAAVTLTDPTIGSCRVEVTGRTVSLELSLFAREPVRAGPELPLNLSSSAVRADGGEWQDVDEPVALSGHRFRLTDGERTMLISAPRPCELFVRPLAGRGLVIWPHWLIRDRGTYRLALTPS